MNIGLHCFNIQLCIKMFPANKEIWGTKSIFTASSPALKVALTRADNRKRRAEVA